MCGSSDNQNQINDQQVQFYKQMQDEYNQQFQQNQDILDQLTSALKPIVTASPSQEGYSPAELAALNTQATESAAMAASQAKQAANERLAAEGGGDNPNLTSGVKDQIDAGIDTEVENNLSNEKLTNLVNSYKQGNQNYENAVGALAGVPGAIEGASSGVANTTTSAGSAAAQEANDIQKANDSWMGILGGIGSAAVGRVKF